MVKPRESAFNNSAPKRILDHVLKLVMKLFKNKTGASEENKISLVLKNCIVKTEAFEACNVINTLTLG